MITWVVGGHGGKTSIPPVGLEGEILYKYFMRDWDIAKKKCALKESYVLSSLCRAIYAELSIEV